MCLKPLSLSLLLLYASAPSSSGLRLTPVLPVAQRLDLAAEARYLSAAYTAAKEIVDLSGDVSADRIAAVLSSDAVRRLAAVLHRWADMERRLRSSPAAMGDQAKLFDSISYGAAAGRAMLGHLYALSGSDAQAVVELEASCPTLWEHQLALKTLDADVSTLHPSDRS